MIKRAAVGLFCLATGALIAWRFLPGPTAAPVAFEQFCRSGSDGREACRLSLVTLAPDPRALGTRLLDSQGYLVIDGGALAIYPTRDVYLSGDRRLALRVRGSESAQRALAISHRDTMIGFRGRTDPLDESSLRSGYMAAILDIDVVAPALLPDPKAGSALEDLSFTLDELD